VEDDVDNDDEEEMDEEDMVNAVVKTLYERDFCTATTMSVDDDDVPLSSVSEDDNNNGVAATASSRMVDSTSTARNVPSSQSFTGPMTTSGVGGAW
jgi:hypothetical protein